MKRIGYLLFAIVCIFFFPLVAHAECDYQRMSELNKIAGNVKFSYNIVLSKTPEGLNKFEDSVINITNITNDIFVVDDVGGIFDFDGEYSYLFSQDVEFKIYSKDPNCPDELLLTKYLETPRINSYYFMPECSDNLNFEYCKIWFNSNDVDSEEFNRKLSEYKKQEAQDVTLQKDNVSDSISVNSWIVSSAIIVAVVLIVLIIVIVMRRRKI